MQPASLPKPPFLTTESGRLVLGAAIGLSVGAYISVAMQLPLRWTVSVVIGLLFPFLAVLSGGVKRFFTAILIVAIPFALSQKMLIYPLEGFHISNGIGFGHLDFTLIVLYALWAIRMVAFPEERKRLRLFSGFNRTVCFYVAVSFLCVLPAQDRMLSIFELVKLFKAMLIFLWVSNNLRTMKEHRAFVLFILMGANLQAIIVILQAFGLFPVAIEGITLKEISVEAYFHGRLYTRPGGILQHSNLLSLYLGMSLPFAFSLLHRPDEDRWFRRYCWFVLLTGVFALVLCFSRAGWFNMAISTTTILFLCYRRIESREQVTRTVFVLAIALGAILIYLWTPIMDRVFGSNPDMLTQRWGMNRDALRMWLDHPFLGAGLNNFCRMLPDYVEEGIFLPVHNTYVLHLAEMGLIGFIAYLLLIFSFLRRTLRLTHVRDGFRSAIAIAMVGSMLGTLEDGFFSFGWKWWVTFYLFWAVAGWMVALERFRDEEDEENSN